MTEKKDEEAFAKWFNKTHRDLSTEDVNPNDCDYSLDVVEDGFIAGSEIEREKAKKDYDKLYKHRNALMDSIEVERTVWNTKVFELRKYLMVHLEHGEESERKNILSKFAEGQLYLIREHIIPEFDRIMLGKSAKSEELSKVERTAEEGSTNVTSDAKDCLKNIKKVVQEDTSILEQKQGVSSYHNSTKQRWKKKIKDAMTWKT